VVLLSHRPRTGLPADHQRAEDLLCQGYEVNGVRDREAIADWLRLARENPDTGSQAPPRRGKPTVTPGRRPGVGQLFARRSDLARAAAW
jgi:hypothetical protein